MSVCVIPTCVYICVYVIPTCVYRCVCVIPTCVYMCVCVKEILNLHVSCLIYGSNYLSKNVFLLSKRTHSRWKFGALCDHTSPCTYLGNLPHNFIRM